MSIKIPIIHWTSSVIALYSKTGGKNGKHAAVTESSNISGLSYVGLQVFENMVNRRFRPTPEGTALFQTWQFALVPSISVLCVLHRSPIVGTAHDIEVSVEDSQIFRGLRAGKDRVLLALKQLRKRKKQADIDGDMSEN